MISYLAVNVIFRHYRTHLKESPNDYNTCGKCFRGNEDLAINKRTHKCDRWSKSFSQIDELTKRVVKRRSRHWRCKIHNRIISFKCDFCEKKNASECSLKNHLTAHSSVKTYSDGNCAKNFAIKKYLSKHQSYIHLQIQNCKIKVCETQFLLTVIPYPIIWGPIMGENHFSVNTALTSMLKTVTRTLIERNT